MAIIVLTNPGPSTATTATASSNDGSAIMMSMARMIDVPAKRG